MSRGKQLARQWQVLKLLENHRFGISLDDLSAKLEISRRTLERDLKSLMELGFPIQSEIREFGKKAWKLTKQFVESDKIILTPTEIISLYLANQMTNPLAGTYLENGWTKFLSKIQAILPPTVLGYFAELDQILYVKRSQQPALIPTEYVEIFRKALKESIILKIYYKRDDKQSSLTLHPYGLTVYENAFYVIGYCEELNEIRTYKLQRITKIEWSRKKFKKPNDFSLEKCFKGCFGIIENRGQRPKTVRCEMTGWAARTVREQKWHRTQVIEQDDGRRVVVSFLLDSTVDFIRWFLGFGDSACVIEPQETKQEIIRTLQNSLKNHEKL